MRTCCVWEDEVEQWMELSVTGKVPNPHSQVINSQQPDINTRSPLCLSRNMVVTRLPANHCLQDLPARGYPHNTKRHEVMAVVGTFLRNAPYSLFAFKLVCTC